MDLFVTAHERGEGGQKGPKICYTYPTIMKFGKGILYLKNPKNIKKSRDSPREFCLYQHFFTGNQQLLLDRNADIDC